MKFQVVTLFPEAFNSYLASSILGRSIGSGLTQVEFINPRQYGVGKHKQVDNAPYGGGPGMVLMVDPFWQAISENISHADELIFFTPSGETLTSGLVQDWAKMDSLAMVCGHYEGFDARLLQICHLNCGKKSWQKLREVSLGDYVLTGGELPAMAVIDAVSRFHSGVLGNAESAPNDSFQQGLIEHRQYTRPAVTNDLSVPAVLLNGNHKEIFQWQLFDRLKRTYNRRPDLFKKYYPSRSESQLIASEKYGKFSKEN